MQTRMQELYFDPARPWLAPLAGYTDLTFRMLCREHGAGVCCTEMVSAKGLMYGSSGTKDLLHTTEGDQPLVVQLFGGEPDVFTAVMPAIIERGFHYFDCNMGCSVPKVTRTGSGAALLKDVPRAIEVARAMVRCAGEGKVGFKIRLGWDADGEIWRELAQGLEDAGAAWLTLHPRFAREGFTGRARWEAIGELVRLVHIPVIASGDLFTAEDGVACLRQTGAATLMYARGAMQQPDIFAAHTALWEGRPAPRSDLRAMIERHLDLAAQFGDEHAALLKMRTFAPRYVHAMPGAKDLRRALTACRDRAALDALLNDFFGRTEPSA